MARLNRLSAHIELVVAALIAVLLILGLVLARSIEQVPGPGGATLGAEGPGRQVRTLRDHGVEP